MRFTRRTGGPMVTVHTRHDLLPYHVTAILCRFSDRLPVEDWPENGGQPSPAAVERLVRVVLAEHGSAYLGEDRWDAEMDPGDAQKLATWAIELVRRLYPRPAAQDRQFSEFASEFGL